MAVTLSKKQRGDLNVKRRKEIQEKFMASLPNTIAEYKKVFHKPSKRKLESYCKMIGGGETPYRGSNGHGKNYGQGQVINPLAINLTGRKVMR